MPNINTIYKDILCLFTSCVKFYCLGYTNLDSESESTQSENPETDRKLSSDYTKTSESHVIANSSAMN